MFPVKFLILMLSILCVSICIQAMAAKPQHLTSNLLKIYKPSVQHYKEGHCSKIFNINS
jgi:hypothetical protein